MFGAVSSLAPPLWPQGTRGWGKRSSACLVSHGHPGLPCEVPQLDHSVFFSPCLLLFSILESSHSFTMRAFLPFSSARCVHSILCSNIFPRWHYSLPCLSPSPFLPVLWLLCPPRWVESSWWPFISAAFTWQLLNWTSNQVLCDTQQWKYYVFHFICHFFFSPLLVLSASRVYCVIKFLIVGRVNPYRKPHTGIYWMIDQLNESVNGWVDE